MMVNQMELFAWEDDVIFGCKINAWSSYFLKFSVSL